MTLVGMIPIDWEVATIKDYGHLQSDGINPQQYKEKDFVEYSMPSYDEGQTPSKCKGASMNSNRTQIRGEVLLFNKLNVRQKRVWYIENAPQDAVCSMEFLAYSSNKVDLRLLREILLQDMVTKSFESVSRGTSNSQKRIAPSDFLNFSFALPPLDEQHRIADALSGIDKLISALDEAIAKKQQVKEGLMQQLLTGKTAIPGFGGEWKSKRVGDIGFTYSGLTGKAKNDFGHGEAQYITFLNVLNNPVLKTDIFERVDVRGDERQNAAKKGDLFFNTSSETPEEVGICALLNSDIDNLYLNSFCFGFRLTDPDVDGLYLSYFWRSKQGREIMSALAQGATRYNLSKEYFNKAIITLPPIELQRYIANTITAADKEIAELELKRDKYLLVKQGMMQELLTGQTRLV